MPDNGRKAFGDIAPGLAQYTDDVLFGDVWERPGLMPRDRSLVTIACLISLYRTNELPFHLKKALDNGVTRGEITETITHLVFRLADGEHRLVDRAESFRRSKVRAEGELSARCMKE